MIPQSNLTGTDFHKLFRPCIYFWYRRDRCLYIGCSMCGFRRLFNPHKVVDDIEPVQDTDHFKFIWFDKITSAELRFKERQFIYAIQPKYNNKNFQNNPKTLLAVLKYAQANHSESEK